MNSRGKNIYLSVDKTFHNRRSFAEIINRFVFVFFLPKEEDLIVLVFWFLCYGENAGDDDSGVFVFFFDKYNKTMKMDFVNM